MSNNDVILAIDIGSTKINAMFAQKMPHGPLEIIGSGISKSQGVKKGTIVNIELASRAIKQAISDARRVAGTSTNKATLSISGTYVKSINSSGIVNIPNKEIGKIEITRVMQTALYNANIPAEYEVLHALPFNFRVDDQDFIEDPLGMNAGRLEVEVRIITTLKSNLYNLKKAVRSAGVDIENIVLDSYASSIACLNDDEKELGVALIDIGGATSDFVIHIGNSIKYDDYLGVGSNHITNDLSMALHTPLGIAEKVKIKYGNLRENSSEVIELPLIGDDSSSQEVSLEVVYNVIFARVEETLMILAKSIEKSGLRDQLGAGIVLTGGMTKLGGIRDLAVAIFDNMSVRIAKPKDLEGISKNMLDPEFSTIIGLALYSQGEHTRYEIDSNKKVRFNNDIIPEEQSSSNVSSMVQKEHQEEEKEERINKITEESLKEKDDFKLPPQQMREEESFDISKFWRWLTQLF